MLRTPVSQDKYKFRYNYNNFIVYSNIEENALAITEFPILLNNYNDSILECLITNSSLLKFICAGKKVLAIALVGSRCLEITDEYSDYDLLVITDDESEYIDSKQNYYIVYNNEIGIHWYQLSKNLLFDVESSSQILEFVRYWNLSLAKFIAVWDCSFINTLNKAMPKLLQHGCITFYKRLETDIILPILETKVLRRTKLLYHLCVASHFLENTPLNKALLKELKRIKYKNISKDCEDYCIKRLLIFKDLVKAFKQDNKLSSGENYGAKK